MANIRPIPDKNGKVTSYEITVTNGSDAQGKPVRHRMSWKPEPGMAKTKMEKTVQAIAVDFEKKIKLGEKADTKISFSEYAEQFMGRKERTLKHNTVLNYRRLLERINAAIGHIKLRDLRPEHIEKFLDNLRERGLRETGNRAVATRLLPALEERKLTRCMLAEMASINVATVEVAAQGKRVALTSAEKMARALDMPTEKLFMVTKATEPLSEKMILGYYALLHLIMQDAYKNGYVEYNIVDRVERPKPVDKEIQSLQPEQVAAIFEALETTPLKWRVITHLLLVTGCRRGEITGLRWSKIDFEHGQLKIDSTILYSEDRGLYEGTTKTKQMRIVNIPAETVELLQEYRAWYDAQRASYGELWQVATSEREAEYERKFKGSDFIFVQEGGWPIHPDSINSWLRVFAKENDLPHLNPHKFRHTQASVLIYSGADVVSVAKRLGHAQVSTTTNIYAHAIMEADARNSDCIADVFFRRKNEQSG